MIDAPSTRSRLWRAKIVWAAVLCPVFALFYHGSQRIDLAPVRLLAHDPVLLQLVPLDLNSVWLYLSMYPLLILVALLLPSISLTHRYGISLAILGTVSCAIFLFFPSAVPRTHLTGDMPPLYRWLIDVDLPRNAFPSLHASLSILAGMFFHRLASTWKKFAWLGQIAVWIWVAGIFWSTVALRQHVLFDLLTGGVLGFFVGNFLLPKEKAGALPKANVAG